MAKDEFTDVRKLRLYFATSAMTGLLAGGHVQHFKEESKKRLAKLAFEIADTMIEEANQSELLPRTEDDSAGAHE